METGDAQYRAEGGAVISGKSWIWTLIQRVFCNAIVGGFTFAGVAIGCGIFAGGLTGLLQDGWDGLFIGAFFGVMASALSGLAGALIYGIAAARAQPGETLRPYQKLCGPIGWGQVWGTLAASSFYLLFELARAQLQKVPLSKIGDGDAWIFFFAAPILMICGAIVGAFWKREANR